MPYFTRLTDIVTCSLTEILDGADNPEVTLREVILEMEEGLAGARRSARTASSNQSRLQREIEEHAGQIDDWVSRARQALQEGREDSARGALLRKVEIEDLVDGLKPELEAARKTHEHMQRIQKALEARHSEAVRRFGELMGSPPEVPLQSDPAVHSDTQSRKEKQEEVEAELEALKRQLGS